MKITIEGTQKEIAELLESIRQEKNKPFEQIKQEILKSIREESANPQQKFY